MSKRSTVGLAVLGAIALAVVVGAVAARDKRPPPARVEEETQIVSNPAPTAAPGAPAPHVPNPPTSRADETPQQPNPPTMHSLPAGAGAIVAANHQRRFVGTAAQALLVEATLMARLHELGETNPPLSLQLAREGNARFPSSPDAPERAWIVVKSLVNMAQFKEAQAEARIMVAKYPNDPRALDVQRHLLTNPP
jgi:hypothetical protein